MIQIKKVVNIYLSLAFYLLYISFILVDPYRADSKTVK